ncbi:putative protein, containings caspase domain [Nostoc flagelliforme CCNUN1]|uniref:Caspase domain-containing protein n=1 Tax=Nostoc flagelliforme CCNUN1 TaxID=2038116 RepID=A0A2K8T3Q1_9NOSO|nr:caspase family protein [Nostoc flagelliforme]AUB42332.1 putative protein, containings caspase domain [Nostoc flagelliforme CCNUN1]
MNGKTRYYLIACGTSEYKNFDDDKQLASVETDLERVVNLFTHNFGYERVLVGLDINPNMPDITLKFADWLQNEERCETDCVIFYYSGHGEYLQGDRHYLLMGNTDPNKIAQTALPTEDLVRPLKNQRVKISQILYIIDTCYSQSGAGDIANIASSVIQQYQPVEGANIAVHAIAACRAKQTAIEGVFSNALEEILKDWMLKEELKEGYINPNELVDKINQKIRSETQRVVHNNVGSETLAKFFHILPKTLQTWEGKHHEFIEELLQILNNNLESSLFFINSFLLSRQLNEKFVVDEQDLKDKLKYLAIKPVSDRICPLIACSEWCRLKFGNRNDETYNLTLVQKIEKWQDKVIKCREGVDLNKIQEFVNRSFDEFEKLIKKGNLRIQIEVEPEINAKEGTGKETGLFLLNMNLWIESQDLPLGRFAESLLLKPEIEENDGRKSETLLSRLEKDNLLSNLIRQARYSLPKQVKPAIEIFLPLDFYQESLENICFKRGRKQEELGKEYPIFVNSFERYFDQDFREIRDEIYENKKALWNNNDNHLDSEIYYIGKKPSKSDLEMIEETKAIAVWSRNDKKLLVEGDEGDIKISEWKNWPKKIQNLRTQNQNLEITLFWDDLYPKPSLRSRPLNTKVVE